MERDSQLVSIITPCLNAGRYIQQAMQSVMAQEYSNVEHIIVDGGSTDNTLSVIHGFSGKYRLNVLRGRDSGPPEAVNKGMRIAKGGIIGVLAADDLLFPWSIGSVVDAFRRRPHSDVVYGDVILMPMDGKYATVSFNPQESNLRVHLAFGPINMHSVFWKKHVSDNLRGFNEQLLVAPDYDFCIRAAQHFKFLKIQELLACFRYREESISLKDKNLLRRNRMTISSKYFGGRRILSIQLLLYELRWAASCATELMRALECESTYSRNKSWKTLQEDKAIARLRLFRELFFAPLFYTNAFFGRMVRHGFIDADRLLKIAIDSR